MAWTRRIAYSATDSSTPDISPETGAGAWRVGVGQPAVHRREAGLGGEAQDRQRDRDPGQVRVQRDVRRSPAVPTTGSVSPAATVAA